MDWLQRKVMHDATVWDLGWLVVIGLLVSAWIWFVFESLKAALRWQSPHSGVQRVVLVIGPIVLGLAMGWIGFPAALDAVGTNWPADSESQAVLDVASLAMGLTAGLGAQVSHEHVGAFLKAGAKAVLSRIRGLGKS